jgi:hypothetical protein
MANGRIAKIIRSDQIYNDGRSLQQFDTREEALESIGWEFAE